MMVDTACPHCHHPCSWSNTSETKYVRCAFCERTFVVSTLGIGQPLHRKPRRRRTPLPLWPWFLFAVGTCLVVGIGSLAIHFQRERVRETKVTVENFQRLRLGMTDRDVLNILGASTRTDRSLVPQLDVNKAHHYELAEEEFTQRSFWEDGDNVIWIEFRQRRITKFGGFLEGERIGEETTDPLVKQTQELDNDVPDPSR